MDVNIFIVATIILSILSFVSLYRAYLGPTSADRVIAINVLSTKVTVCIALIAGIMEKDTYVDVALIYSMIGFVGAICVAKYLEKGKLY